jgi:YVTN family beta-propeller protein
MNDSKAKIRTAGLQALLQTTALLLLTCVSGPAPSIAQDKAALRSAPPIVYVSNGGGGITEVNAANHSVIATAPFPNNSNGVVITPDGRRMYATSRDTGQVTVFDTSNNVPLVVIPVGHGTDNVGLAISPDGSVIYVANQFSGTVTVIATASNSVTQTIPTGAEPIWITFSPDGSRAYISNQGSGTISTIATASNSVIANVAGFACPFQSTVTRDGTKLLVSSQCDNSLKVINLVSNTIVNSIPTGPNPRGIALSPDGSRAYVADWFSNSVDVIDVAAEKNLNTPITVGLNPWGIAMTPDGKAYVANFGDNTISVIDTLTNTVSATLNSRGNPEDVTVSTTARPRILNFDFRAFDPPGSVDTVAAGLNSRGENVGRFQDIAGVVHGYLRHIDGSFITIDPPGSISTIASGIDDAGTIFGVWQALSGTYHGFTRSPGGVYTTGDFPGAVDSQFTGANSRDIRVGNYDLGDTNTSIAFVNERGRFTSFEDPAATSMQTGAVSINAAGFISGLFTDSAGDQHGFIRVPNAQFQDFDFPGADFTNAYQLNDVGQTVGQYATNFPNHGFIYSSAMPQNGLLSSCQFLSFDYPDSQNSGTRGINNLGQVAGFYRKIGDTGRHGFIARSLITEDNDRDNQCAKSLGGRHGSSFSSFDYPGATNTQAAAITTSGEIVGRYLSVDGRQHGFRLRHELFVSIDAPNASSTDVAWVNGRDDVVGSYSDANGTHAYVLSKGTFATINFPGSDPANTTTLGFGISNAGDVVGVEFVGGDFSHGHGYLYSHGQFVLVDAPGAVGTFPTMIINPHYIVGNYFGADNLFHGFVFLNGKFSTVDLPNSSLTWITGVNPEGELVGFYNSKDGAQHGFVMNEEKFTSVDVPGSSSTEGNGIDPQGDVVGRYVSLDGKTHAYLLRCSACIDRKPHEGSKPK